MVVLFFFFATRKIYTLITVYVLFATAVTAGDKIKGKWNEEKQIE